jgi:hypothetical protein
MKTTPKTWREVEIERARCEGYMAGFGDARGMAGDPSDKRMSEISDRVAAVGVASQELSAIKMCGVCFGTGGDIDWDEETEMKCSVCHGTGIAP